MKKSIFFFLLYFIFFCPLFLSSQHVLYSPLITNTATSRFEVIGKTGDYYWIQKSKKKGNFKKPTEPWVKDKEPSFEVYDAKMNHINSISSLISDTTFKEYFVSGVQYFDLLTFNKVNNKTIVLLTRYSPEGNIYFDKDSIAGFPASMRGNDFLLVQSADKSKILLMGFEPVPESPPRLHTLLYDKNWQLISNRIYNDKNITQPFIQYDFVNYPLENFGNNPVKLADNGEWLMISQSGASGDYLLFQFDGRNISFTYREIRLPVNSRIAELTLYLDDKKQEAFAGILVNTQFQSIKKVIISHYILSECRFNFDTSFTFNTLAGNKTRNENIFQEYFMTVPGKGFILLKEYGRALSEDNLYQERQSNYLVNETNISFSNSIQSPVNKDDYTRYKNFAGTRKKFDRGDLSIYFFPAAPGDSCWSGIINKAQTTELNSSYLSYVFIPLEDKLIFLHNNLLTDHNYSSTTILDKEGNPIMEGLVFWKMNNTLLFQRARQIAVNELVIPYEKNMRTGFAVVRM